MTGKPICPCETSALIPDVGIPSGLRDLPRQRGRFGDFRRALLAHSRMTESGALDTWPADDDKDLGLLLIEVWAYLLDILSFYDKETAQESYLGVARRTSSATALADLIGYVPKPASAASARIALRVKGADPVTVKKGAALKSEAFNGEKPQVFEVSKDALLHPAHNRWTYAPVRPADFDGDLWVGGTDGAPVVGQLVAVEWGGALRKAAIVAVAETREGRDGARYTRLTLDPQPGIPDGTNVFGIVLHTFAQTAGETAFDRARATRATSGSYNGTFVASSPPATHSTTHLTLDALYPQLATGSPVMIETTGGDFRVATLTGAGKVWVLANQEGTATMPVTNASWGSGVLSSGETPRKLHLRASRVTALTNPAKRRLDEADLETTLKLVDLLEPFSADRPEPASLMLRGAEQRGLESTGAVTVDADTGEAEVLLDDASAAGEGLRAPVRVFGNLVTAIRGETVTAEAVGSGNAQAGFQTFTLKKGPLTYLPLTTEASGLAPELEVRVNGILWTRVPTLLNSGANDEHYTVRTDSEGKGVIGFGDGVTGKRPPSGTNNITATYRHGAGSAKPGDGQINAVAKAIPGIDGVAFSLAATGGSDAETADDIRDAAPASALTFGRAVSLADYSALARAYPGVVNAAAGWSIDPASQRAAVRIWAISDGGSAAPALAGYLRALGDPDVVVTVTEAAALDSVLSTEIAVDPAFKPEDVQAAVIATLSDRETGLLAPANATIGQGIFHSEISAAIQNVRGVSAVLSLTFTGPSVAAGLPASEGEYRTFSQFDVRVIA